jgi:hypothetical protein
MPTMTPPWTPDPVDARELLHVPRRWPTTTVYVSAVAVLFTLLCWAESAR